MAPESAGPGATRPGRRPSLLLLVGLAAVGPFAMNVVVPAMPALAKVFDTTYGVMQLVLTAYLAATAAIQLVLGPLSDRFGRRPVILYGMGFFLLGSVICACATTVEVLIAGRIIQAAGACAGLVIGRAIIRDVFGREQAASNIGYVTMAMVVAPMLAPAVGGYLFDHQGWQAMFWLSLLLGLAILAVSLRHLHETRQPSLDGEVSLSWNAVLGLLRDRFFCGYTIVLACASGIFFTFLAGAAYVVTEIMGRPASEYGLYFILSAVGYVLGNFLSGRYAVRVGLQRMITIGCGFAALGLLLLWGLSGIQHTAALFGPMFVLALSNGLTLPSAMASAVSARPRLAGTAAGIAGFAQIGLGALLAFVVGVLQEGSNSALPMMIIMTAAGLVSFAGFAMTRRG
ncbi:MAG: multidrug effflux MFS transporter [Kiloniellales bacterium]|nr:multidrug effflux MFS transporter [Kiloniellales bacterium]